MIKKVKVNDVLDELRKVMGRPVGVTLLYDNDGEFVVQTVEGLQVPPPEEPPSEEIPPLPVEVPALSEPARVKEE